MLTKKEFEQAAAQVGTVAYHRLDGMWNRICVVNQTDYPAHVNGSHVHLHQVEMDAEIELGGQNGYYDFLPLTNGLGRKQIFRVMTGARKGMWTRVVRC